MVSPVTEPLTHVEIPEPRPAAVKRVRPPHPNVGELERVASIFAGSLLIARSLHKLSLFSALRGLLGYRLIQRGVTGQCSLYRALHVTSGNPDDSPLAKALSNPFHQHFRIEKSIIIGKPIEEVYDFWRHIENFPRFMTHLESVQVFDEKHSHWVATAPGRQTIEWDADIVDEIPNKRIAWKSAESASVPNSGQVIFSPASDNRATHVQLLLAYDPPAGIFGALFAKLLGQDPDRQLEKDLFHAKELLEAAPSHPAGGQPNPDGQH